MLVLWVITLATGSFYFNLRQEELPKQHVVCIAFNDSKQPLGWGTDKIVIHTPGYVYEVAKYDCLKGHTIQLMVPNSFHVIYGETIEVTE